MPSVSSQHAVFEARSRLDSRKLWALAIAAAIVWHAIGLLSRPFWLVWDTTGAPPHRMPIETVSADQLRAMRKKLGIAPLVTDRLKPSERAPENARYISDRNVQVEKEQRARRGQEGAQNTSATSSSPAQATPPSRRYQIHSARLGNLGVPFRLTTRAPRDPSVKPAQAQGKFAGGDGSEQQLRENDLPEGSQNLLNAQESVFYSFFERMRESVQPNWVREARERVTPIAKNLSPGDYYTVLQVTLDVDGNVINTQVAHSSGVTALDDAAKSSFWRVKRFPNPPQGIRDPDGRTRFPVGFSFEISPDVGFQYNYYDPWQYR